jgi:hypothetical protein
MPQSVSGAAQLAIESSGGHQAGNTSRLLFAMSLLSGAVRLFVSFSFADFRLSDACLLTA